MPHPLRASVSTQRARAIPAHRGETAQRARQGSCAAKRRAQVISAKDGAQPEAVRKDESAWKARCSPAFQKIPDALRKSVTGIYFALPNYENIPTQFREAGCCAHCRARRCVPASAVNNPGWTSDGGRFCTPGRRWFDDRQRGRGVRTLGGRPWRPTRNASHSSAWKGRATSGRMSRTASTTIGPEILAHRPTTQPSSAITDPRAASPSSTK